MLHFRLVYSLIFVNTKPCLLDTHYTTPPPPHPLSHLIMMTVYCPFEANSAKTQYPFQKQPFDSSSSMVFLGQSVHHQSCNHHCSCYWPPKDCLILLVIALFPFAVDYPRLMLMSPYPCYRLNNNAFVSRFRILLEDPGEMTVEKQLVEEFSGHL